MGVDLGRCKETVALLLMQWALANVSLTLTQLMGTISVESITSSKVCLEGGGEGGGGGKRAEKEENEGTYT